MSQVGFDYILQDDKFTELSGISHKDFYRNLQSQISAQKKTFRIVEKELGIEKDESLMLRLGAGTAAARVMGCETVYPENSEPWVIPMLHGIREVESLEVPEPQDNPAVQDILNKSEEFEKLTGIKSDVYFDGPVTTAALCRGRYEFFLDTYRAPSLCRKLVERCTSVAVRWIEYHEEEMGIEKPVHNVMTDDHAAFLSPKLYDELGFPYELSFYESFPERKWRYLHMCGPTSHLLERINNLKLSIFEIGEMVDLKKAKRIFAETHIARLFDFRLLLTGSEGDVVRWTNEQIETGARDDNFSIHIEAWRGITFERIRLVKNIIEEFNKDEKSLYKR